MRAHWFRASSSVVALLLGMASAHAQENSGTGTLNISRTSSQSGNAEVEVGGVQARAVVDPAEQIAQAEQIARRAGQLAERLSKMLAEARREKDIMRANCVNRKLTEVNANTRNVQQRAKALRDANTSSDQARRNHEFTVLTVLSQKLNSLDQEATQCLGQSVYEPGASQVITTIPEDSPMLNPSVIDPATAAPPSISVPPPNLNSPPDMSPTR
jgi:hypothetical protein